MRTLMRTTTLLALIVLGGTAVARAQVSFDIRIGPPPPPPVVRVHPVRPGPNYFWVDGYWYPVGNHYKWRQGYWARPPYAGAHWIGPRYSANRYRAGYWDGHHGRYGDRGHRYDHRDHR